MNGELMKVEASSLLLSVVFISVRYLKKKVNQILAPAPFVTGALWIWLPAFLRKVGRTIRVQYKKF